MDPQTLQPTLAEVLVVATRQHDLVTRAQLLAMGLGSDAIRHRLRNGRLHPIRRGVYAVGRPKLTRLGTLMAAVLSCGPDAALSHDSAAELWGIRARANGAIEVAVPASVARRGPGLVVHRRVLRVTDLTRHHGIPVTTPVCTLVDLATRLTRRHLEAAINGADKLGLADPETLRSALDGLAGRHGVAALRETLDRRTFALTESELERRFLPIARKAGLAPPQTQQQLNGFRVDFYWPELGLVVETDGLRYHRTPAQQARDRLRDQVHVAAGLTPLRFTHAQVAFEAAHVESTLAAVVRRLKPAPTASPSAPAPA
jgi:very-short-patch-repair endonuclease